MNKGIYNFTKNERLLSADEFQVVFKNGDKISNKFFFVSTNRNRFKHPRLGTAISKKK